MIRVILKISYSLLISVAYVLLTVFEREANFADIGIVSFWLFIISMFILSLDLNTDEDTLEDKLKNIHKHKDYRDQLFQVEKMIEKLERKRDYNQNLKEELGHKRTVVYNRIKKLNNSITVEMRDKNEKLIIDYQVRMKKIKDLILELDDKLSDDNHDLDILYVDVKHIKGKIKSNRKHKENIDKKLSEFMKV